MNKIIILSALLFCQCSLGCVSNSDRVDNSAKDKLEALGKVVMCSTGDGDGDGIDDIVALIQSGDNIRFAFMASSFNDKVFQSKSMLWDGCQGSCGVDDVYLKKGSVFIQGGEKNYSSASAKTFQFKFYGQKLKLIGVKLQVFSSTEENEIEVFTDDVNWGTGKRIVTTKYANGKVTTENKKMVIHEIVFENFDLSSVPLY